jgi:hypothetical protein
LNIFDLLVGLILYAPINGQAHHLRDDYSIPNERAPLQRNALLAMSAPFDFFRNMPV